MRVLLSADKLVVDLLALQLYTATDLDAAIHTIVTHARSILGHTNNHHTWYRLALTGSGNQAATMYDDLTQVRFRQETAGKQPR